MPKQSIAQLTTFIKGHAITNYAQGWDVVVETYEDAQIADVLRNATATSNKAAIAAFAPIVGAFHEQRDMHRNEALLMGAEPTQDEIASGKVEALLGAPDLTALEKAVIVALLEAGIECNGCETLADMQADNMCVADVAELSNRTGLTKAQLKGVISSLSSKGLVCANIEKVNRQPGVDQWLDTGALPLAFELIAEGVETTAPNAAPKLPGDATPKQVKSVKVADAPKAARKARTLDDRVILAPGKAEAVRPTKEGSKRALLVQALQRGTTLEHLQELLGWNRDTVSSAIRTDVGAIGLGVERRAGKYYLLLPEGMKDLPLRDATTTRADALVAACGK